MLRKSVVGFCALVSFCFVGCASRQLCKDLSFVSTNSKISATESVKKSTKNAQVSAFYLCGIPLGDEPTPQSAFNKLNEGADYVNNLELKPSGWSFSIPVSDAFSIGIAKRSWTASGTIINIEQ